jgi:predicted dehydrogenase
MTRQLSVGMIGCGGISRYHIENMANTPAIRLVATMDTVEEVARERGEEGGAEYWTTDLDRLLCDQAIEAVLICTPHLTHTDLTLRALSAGKHVFVEKPPSMTVAQARKVQQASHESGLQVMSGWWFKHSPITKRLREVIEKPRFILFTCRIPSIDPHTGGGWDPDPYARNGILDVAGYNLHWIWHVMRSQPVEVMAMGLDQSASNTCSILIQFANGGMADSVTGHMGGGGILPKTYAEVGSEGVSGATLRFGNLVFEGTEEPGIEENTYHNGFNEELGMFARLCLEGGPNPMDAWEANVPTVIFEKAVESMNSRRPVAVDMAQEFYLPDGKLPLSIENFGDLD